MKGGPFCPLHLNVEPVLRLADPAAEAVDVGGVGHAEDVLQEAATAEQQVLTLPTAQQQLLSVWDGGGRVVEVLAEVLLGRLV